MQKISKNCHLKKTFQTSVKKSQTCKKQKEPVRERHKLVQKVTKCEKKKKKKNRIAILIIATKVYNVLLCRIGIEFTEDHESLFIKSYTLNHIKNAY